MSKFLIHHVVVINYKEKHVTGVYEDYELPQDYQGYFDIDTFEEKEVEKIISKAKATDLYLIEIPQVHVLSICDVPMLKAPSTFA
jgi:hypothetical protein